MNCEIDFIGMSTVYSPSFEHDKLLQLLYFWSKWNFQLILWNV